MKKLTTFLFALYIVSAFAQTDVNVNPNLTFNGESNLALNPLNANLTAEWMKLTLNPTTISMVTSYSSDHGATWSTPNVFPHFYVSPTSADPTMVYHHSGKLYAA